MFEFLVLKLENLLWPIFRNIPDWGIILAFSAVVLVFVAIVVFGVFPIAAEWISYIKEEYHERKYR